jgi:hypothetical protein
MRYQVKILWQREWNADDADLDADQTAIGQKMEGIEKLV